jgi:hypothetical protein
MNFNRGFTRRRLLGSLAGGTAATALAPFVPLLEGTAQAQTPKRLLLIFYSGGIGANQYLPTGTESDFKFPTISASLEPHKKKLIVLGNLRRAQDNAKGSHQAGTSGIWTGARMLGAGTGAWVSHPSIDTIISTMVPQPTAIPVLRLDVQSEDGGNLRGNTMYGMDCRPIRGEQDPSRAFDRLFTNGVSAPPGAPVDPALGEKLRARRKSVLDLVNHELSALSNRLGGQDRKKMEQHLEAVRSAELRLSEPAGGNGGIAGYKPPSADAYQKLDFMANDNYPKVAELQLDLAVAALATDRSRLVNLQMSQGNGDIVYRWVGVTSQHHALTHRGDAAPGLDNIRKWYYERFAGLLARMDAIKEGSGTMLDNTLVVWGNEFVSGSAHDTDPWPVILAGSGGGRFKTGRFINFPMAGNGPRLFPGEAAANATPNQTQLLTSLCHYMGAKVPRVGDPTMGPAGQLEALG